MLFNIGILESSKLAKFDCYILHDVDLVPIDSRIQYRCGENPQHFAVNIKHQGNKESIVMFDACFGGIDAISRDQLLSINGNSNLYFGWGGEDDDLRERLLGKGFIPIRGDSTVYRFLMLSHTSKRNSTLNEDRLFLLKSARKRYEFDGLNSAKYKVNSMVFDKLYTWIKVSIDMTGMLEQVPYNMRWQLRSTFRMSKNISAVESGQEKQK